MTKYSVRVSQQVYKKLLRHTKFIANVNTSAAHKFIMKWEGIVNSLENFPERGMFIDSEKIFRKINFYKSFKIIYKIDDECVLIYDIVDNRECNNY